MEWPKDTSALLPVAFSFRCLHSALRSFRLRGKYRDARAWESRRLEGRPAFALELILRTAWANLVTGGVTLDMMLGVVEMLER